MSECIYGPWNYIIPATINFKIITMEQYDNSTRNQIIKFYKFIIKFINYILIIEFT